ncbi:unnamed protein product [Clavelina lepadiformis]|uniref:Uncharacterized protein n=1 Tax=Clavelina lepadiformis TaxID=159417 RepID=A0ABP0GF23_CLALP
MSKTSALKPAKLEVDINCETACKLWKHWKRTFDNFLAELAQEQISTAPPINKLQLLTNFVSAEIFEFIEDCNTYDSAVEILQELLVKKPNEIFARHLLTTRKQQPSESTVTVKIMASSRVEIVTGGNKGIGLAIVRALSKVFNGDVCLTARTMSKDWRLRNSD